MVFSYYTMFFLSLQPYDGTRFSWQSEFLRLSETAGCDIIRKKRTEAK